jgi:eukaryotic-like serine/threonine-protein kinase
MVSQTLGHYRIEEELGAGGMGVVYRATDGKLGRQVAIKVLPEVFARHPERLTRFEREARMLAALNHPNIAAIHGLEECGGVHYLVLELVPGLTLAQRIAQGPLPFEEAFGVSRQITEALEAAHEKGIVHRDLKPANVKITPEGKVKVLDFGLAKALDAPSTGGTNSSESPTVTAQRTEIGKVMGTAAYMSPEQARGRPVDKRTDIWAFGCVLFEALTGRQAFAGETMSDCLAAVLAGEPDWDALPASTPSNVRALLRRCLEKDPRRRLRDVGDAGIELEEALPARDSRPLAEAQTQPEPKRGMPAGMAIGFVAGAVVLGLATHPWRQDVAPRPVIRFSIPLAPNEEIRSSNSPNVTISPDGIRVAYASWQAGRTGQVVSIRAMDGQEAKAVKDAAGGVPFFSPDSKSLGFLHGVSQTIRALALSGGAPLTVTSTDAIAGASWGEDGNIVWGFFDLLSVPATGGPAKTLLKADLKSQERFYRQPWHLPGGKAILFTVVTDGIESYDDAKIGVLSLDSSQKKILIEGGMCPRYSPTGHLVYARAGSLLAVPFDVKKLAVTGQPFHVLDGVFMSASTGMAAFAISANGDLAYAAGPVAAAGRLPVWVDRQGAAKALPLPPRAYLHPRFSPDDRQVVMEIESPTHDSYSYDTSRETLTRCSFDGRTHWPIWTAGGERIAFRSGRTALMSIWSTPADRSGEDERLTPVDGYMQTPESVSPDGRAMLFTQRSAETGADIFVLPLTGDRRARPLLQSKFDEGAPKFSPDGNWVAYCSNESGKPEVYVTPYPGPGPKVLVSTDGGSDPVWRRKGGELYFRRGTQMMVVQVTTQPKLTLSKPRVLWDGAYMHGTSSSCGGPGVTSSNYDVSADGERFVMIEERTQDVVSRQVNVVVGWAEELKRAAQARN